MEKLSKRVYFCAESIGKDVVYYGNYVNKRKL